MFFGDENHELHCDLLSSQRRSRASRSSAYCRMPNPVRLILVPDCGGRARPAKGLGASLRSSNARLRKETPDRGGLSAGAFRGHCLRRPSALAPRTARKGYSLRRMTNGGYLSACPTAPRLSFSPNWGGARWIAGKQVRDRRRSCTFPESHKSPASRGIARTAGTQRADRYSRSGRAGVSRRFPYPSTVTGAVARRRAGDRLLSGGWSGG